MQCVHETVERNGPSGGLDCETLLTEAPVAVPPASPRLARRPGLRMADLAGEDLHPRPASPDEMKSLSELMHLIALGRKVAVLPRVLTRPLRDDLVTVPMTDLPPVALLLAWPAHSRSRSVAALARAAAAAIGASESRPDAGARPGTAVLANGPRGGHASPCDRSGLGGAAV